jgi:hypothetical protein
MSVRWDKEAARMAIPEVARRKLAKLALAILTTLCLLTGASAQSIDPDHPAPRDCAKSIMMPRLG